MGLAVAVEAEAYPIPDLVHAQEAHFQSERGDDVR